jgi:phospholipid N-methyltransferase
MAGVVKNQTGQEMAEGGPGSGLMTPLVREHRLDALEQVAIEDRRLFARIDMAFVVDLANVEAIAQQVE